MTDTIDPVELLNSLAPPAGWDERVELSTDERAAAIFDSVVSGNVIPFRAPRRRLRIVTGVVVAATLGGAGVAAFVQRSDGEDRTVSCWSEAVLDPAAQVALGWDGEADVTQLCTTAWSDGTLGSDGPPAPLQLCISNEEGVVAAIPGDDDVCADLDLERFTPPEPSGDDLGDLVPGGDDEPADVDALERLLERKYTQANCFTEQEALTRVGRTLEEFKFDGWATQTLGTFRAADTCASTSVVRDQKTVLIVPLEPPTDVPN